MAENNPIEHLEKALKAALIETGIGKAVSALDKECERSNDISGIMRTHGWQNAKDHLATLTVYMAQTNQISIAAAEMVIDLFKSVYQFRRWVHAPSTPQESQGFGYVAGKGA